MPARWTRQQRDLSTFCHLSGVGELSSFSCVKPSLVQKGELLSQEHHSGPHPPFQNHEVTSTCLFLATVSQKMRHTCSLSVRNFQASCSDSLFELFEGSWTIHRKTLLQAIRHHDVCQQIRTPHNSVSMLARVNATTHIPFGLSLRSGPGPALPCALSPRGRCPSGPGCSPGRRCPPSPRRLWGVER